MAGRRSTGGRNLAGVIAVGHRATGARYLASAFGCTDRASMDGSARYGAAHLSLLSSADDRRLLSRTLQLAELEFTYPTSLEAAPYQESPGSRRHGRHQAARQPTKHQTREHRSCGSTTR